MADWRTQLGDRLISPEAAADMVKSGQSVVFGLGREAHAFGLALAARMGELRNVRILSLTPGYDFGWYDEGWQDAFDVTIGMATGVCQEGVDAHRVDVHPFYLFNYSQPLTFVQDPDFLAVEISPPDDRGFCSFGQSVWNKKRQIREARARGVPVIAEINANMIRTYGDNFIHISEIDYFIEHASTGAAPSSGTLAGRAKKAPEPFLKDIAGNIAQLIRDGDTLQFGVGRTTEPMIALGALEGKRDLGYHSEATAPGIIGLVRQGVINGRRKSVHQGKVIVTSLGGASKQDMEWASDNPIFELLDADYVVDIRTIAANDNMAAINNALTVDLTGQVTSESLGSRMLSASGGHLSFVIGANLSKGGRSIHVMPSTALGGQVSRIVPELPPGTIVTAPRNCTDYIVTEFGVAHLKGKSSRRRAEELIAIAHPDFRPELMADAKRRFWP